MVMHMYNLIIDLHQLHYYMLQFLHRKRRSTRFRILICVLLLFVLVLPLSLLHRLTYPYYPALL
eukprot:UN08699